MSITTKLIVIQLWKTSGIVDERICYVITDDFGVQHLRFKA